MLVRDTPVADLQQLSGKQVLDSVRDVGAVVFDNRMVIHGCMPVRRGSRYILTFRSAERHPALSVSLPPAAAELKAEARRSAKL